MSMIKRNTEESLRISKSTERTLTLDTFGANRLFSSTYTEQIFIFEAIIIYLIAFPTGMRFESFAFNDHGANLTVEYLIRRGYHPGVDFGLNRGLLSLLFAHFWFALFGLKPFSYLLAMPIFDVLIAWGFARFIKRLKLNLAGIAIIFAAAPFAICGVWGDMAHPMEVALLSHALAEHAGGNRGRALVFATAALFALPAMGYIYGLLLLIFSFREWQGSHSLTLKHVGRELAPAAVTGLAFATLLGAFFGIHSVARQMLPITGINNFIIANHGLSSVARSGFLHFPGARITYYIGSIATFWILASLWLLVSGVRSGWALRKLSVRTELEFNYEIVFCIALMHLVFAIVFFDGAWTDAYMLVLGVAATSVWDRGSVTGVWMLVPVAAFGNATLLLSSYRVLRYMDRPAVTANLWAPPEQQREWAHVLKIAKGHKPVLVQVDGAADVLFPEFQGPSNFTLIPGQPTASEILRKARQLSDADMVVIVRFPGRPSADSIALFPTLRDAMAGCKPVWKGVFSTICQKWRNGRTSAGAP